jgi:DNA-directed RNA polymerase specialized sigma24 family protein
MYIHPNQICVATTDNNIDIVIAAFKQKDPKAFAYILALQRRPLTYFAEELLGIREVAEDIVADSFEKLWTTHTDFDSITAIKSFLYSTTRDSCLDFLKCSEKVSGLQKDFGYWVGKEQEIIFIMYDAELLSELYREKKALPKTPFTLYE